MGISAITVATSMAGTDAQHLINCAIHATKKDILLTSVASSMLLCVTFLTYLLLLNCVYDQTILKSVKSVHALKFYTDPERNHSKSWMEFVRVGDANIEFKLDTGAEVNVIPKRLLDRILGKSYVLKPTSIILQLYGGHLLRPVGVISFSDCALNGVSLNLEFVVADVESVPLLGLSACEDFGEIKRLSKRKNAYKNKVCKVSVCATESDLSATTTC